jgi:hypothetical protein
MIVAELLSEEATTRKDFLQVQQEGEREVTTANLNFITSMLIISVGYRVNSQTSHTVPHLGNQYPQTIHHKRLRIRR